jgi:hypothetical protein
VFAALAVSRWIEHTIIAAESLADDRRQDLDAIYGSR